MEIRRLVPGRIRGPLRKVVRRLRRRGSGSHGHREPHVWWDQIYRDLSTYTASGHIGLTEEENRRDFAVRWETLRDSIQRHRQPSHTRLLDAGCGNGVFTERFAEIGFDVTAFDFAPEAIRQARERLGDIVDWRVERVESFESPEPFDFVVCTMLMCIVSDEDHARAFLNLADLVDEKGYLILEELLVPPDEMGPQPPTWERFRFRAWEVYERLAREAGLELLDRMGFHTPCADQDKCVLVFAPGPALRTDRELAAVDVQQTGASGT